MVSDATDLLLDVFLRDGGGTALLARSHDPEG